eukprot:scaffold4869_cov33-Tisochrysis_lutea.AAC.3
MEPPRQVARRDASPAPCRRRTLPKRHSEYAESVPRPLLAPPRRARWSRSNHAAVPLCVGLQQECGRRPVRASRATGTELARARAHRGH